VGGRPSPIGSPDRVSLPGAPLGSSVAHPIASAGGSARRASGTGLAHPARRARSRSARTPSGGRSGQRPRHRGGRSSAAAARPSAASSVAPTTRRMVSTNRRDEPRSSWLRLTLPGVSALPSSVSCSEGTPGHGPPSIAHADPHRRAALRDRGWSLRPSIGRGPRSNLPAPAGSHVTAHGARPGSQRLALRPISTSPLVPDVRRRGLPQPRQGTWWPAPRDRTAAEHGDSSSAVEPCQSTVDGRRSVAAWFARPSASASSPARPSANAARPSAASSGERDTHKRLMASPTRGVTGVGWNRAAPPVTQIADLLDCGR
jgi:hypothetical protein